VDSYLFPYLLLLAHLLSGAFWLWRINRHMNPAAARKQWIKYASYLVLVNLLWFCIVYLQEYFPVLGLFLMVLASMEWARALRKFTPRVLPSLLFLTLLASFFGFLYLDQNLLLFTWFVVVLFDGSCQIAGQVAGRRKLLPRISPRKTLEGLLGGAMITLATSLLVRQNFSFQWNELIFMTCLIMGAAFLGDLLASLVKRQAGIESFGNILPGHGGILDRFDSLIMSGTLVYLISLLYSLGK